MKTLVAMLVALGLSAPFVSTTALAQDTPTDQASCEDAGMVWDADMEICQPAE
jgi:hypothetical protein